MLLENTDIDLLLDATTEIANDDYHYLIRHIEIDTLLDLTQNW